MTMFAFVDMRSGGRRKLGAEVIYIRANDDSDAAGLFAASYGRNPGHVTCPCCGSDYAVLVYEDDAQWYWPRPGEPGALVCEAMQ